MLERADAITENSWLMDRADGLSSSPFLFIVTLFYLSIRPVPFPFPYRPIFDNLVVYYSLQCLPANAMIPYPFNGN